MKIWIIWEHFCETFDIMAIERKKIVKVVSSEESAYCVTETMNENCDDQNISYYYEEHNLEE